MRVGEASNERRLVDELLARELRLILRQPALIDLDRDLGVVELVERQIDRARSAAAELPLDAVLADSPLHAAALGDAFL
jgi:hypothetical protein